jgi:hypothetical protein
MKTIKNITTGALNEFKNFYGNVEIDSDASQEAYDLLEDELDDDMKNSPELWAGEFEIDGKRYAVAGDGALTSDGEYVIAEITDEKTYDIVFNDDTSSNCKGFHESLQYCKDYIAANNGTDRSYFKDYRGGVVSIICNDTQETIYNETVR